MTSVDAAILRNDKWTAFVIVHSRYNPTLPLWFRGPVEELESHLHDKFNELLPSPTDAHTQRIERAREAALGIARHIASMTMFSAESSAAAMTEVTLKKAGLSFFTRDPPLIAANALPHYKGNNVVERMDAILCIEVLAMLCVLVGCQLDVNQLKSVYHFRFEPYYGEVVMKAPDRRSCAQLAAAAWNFREYAFDNLAGRIFKPIEEKPILPVATMGTSRRGSSQASGSRGRSRKAASKSRPLPPSATAPATDGDGASPAAHFSVQRLQEMAGEHSGIENNPASMTLSWFVGHIRQFATVE